MNRDASPTEPVIIPTLYALALLGEAVMLIDAGYRAAAGEEGVRPVTGVDAALAAHGLASGDVTHVVLTHLHVDHVGWLDLFEDAALVCQRAELDYARAPDLLEMEREYPPWDALEQKSWTTVEGDHDLFGDGSVRLLFTPGHTPGHQSVLVSEGDRATLLAGDAVWTRDCLDPSVLPGLLWNAQRYAESRERLRTVADAAGACWVHSHEPDTPFDS